MMLFVRNGAGVGVGGIHPSPQSFRLGQVTLLWGTLCFALGDRVQAEVPSATWEHF